MLEGLNWSVGTEGNGFEQNYPVALLDWALVIKKHFNFKLWNQKPLRDINEIDSIEDEGKGGDKDELALAEGHRDMN